MKGIYQSDKGLIEIYDYSKLHKCYLGTNFVDKGIMFDHNGKQIDGNNKLGEKIILRTIKDKQNLQTDIRTQIIALKSGVIKKLTRMVSAHYILSTEMALLISEMYDELEREQLAFGKIQNKIKKVDKSLDEYFDAFSKLIGEDQRENLINDAQEFDKEFRKWANLTNL